MYSELRGHYLIVSVEHKRTKFLPDAVVHGGNAKPLASSSSSVARALAEVIDHHARAELDRTADHSQIFASA